MGIKEGMAESLLRGGTFGLSDLLGITGGGGLIHDTDDDDDQQAILVDDDGLYFIESKIQIGWDDVVEIVDENRDGTLYRFELRGGLIIHTGWIAGDVSDYMESPSCTDSDLADLDSDNLSADSCDSYETGITNIRWAIDLASKIRGSQHLGINETYWLGRLACGCWQAWMFAVKSSNAPKKIGERILDTLSDEAIADMQHALRNQVQCMDEDDLESSSATIGLAFYLSKGWPPGETGDGIEHQKEVYDTIRSARAWGWDVNAEDVQTILASDDEEDARFGCNAWANYRKMIVCTDERSARDTIENGVKIQNVMVMDAQDIIAYNDTVSEDVQLHFEANHPQNGVTYIQHPFHQNTYLSIETYHATLLERKYEELKHLLTCLGATSLELTTESSSTRDEKQSSKKKIDADASVDGIGGISGGFSNADHSARMAALCKTLSTKRVLRPKGKPYIPEDLEFYPTEQGWQHLAKLVLDGRIKSEEVTLTYRNESAISGNTLRSISAKLHSLVPSYCFGVGGNFEAEYESELKSLESLTWNYNVQFGDASKKRVDDEEVDSQAAIKGQSTKKKCIPKEDPSELDGSPNKAEQLFLKRARRYAQSEGHMDCAQRADLEAFAQKYDIDDFRMEELIEKAFE